MDVGVDNARLEQRRREGRVGRAARGDRDLAVAVGRRVRRAVGVAVSEAVGDDRDALTAPVSELKRRVQRERGRVVAAGSDARPSRAQDPVASEVVAARAGVRLFAALTLENVRRSDR